MTKRKKKIKINIWKIIYILLSILFSLVSVYVEKTNLPFIFKSIINVLMALIMVYVITLTVEKEDRKPLLALLGIIIVITSLIYYKIDNFEDIITIAVSIIYDIIINEIIDTKSYITKAKCEISQYKNSTNESYIELYFNYKKTVTKIFIYTFCLCLIIANTILNLHKEKIGAVFVLICLFFAFSALLSVLIIDFILKDQNKSALFRLRKENYKFPDVDEEISPFLGDYTDEEIQTLEGKYNYFINIREMRERIYAILVKETFEKNNNKPNPIKYLDEILEGSESNKSNKDDCKRIIKALQKIKRKMGKENIEKDTIISVENCIRALQSEEVLKDSESNENNDDYPEIIEALQKIKKKMEKDKVAKEKINSVEKCIKSLQIKNRRMTMVAPYKLNDIIGRTVTVTVDRPLGSAHPNYKDMIYTVNYGYIEGLIAPDGEEQDAYILGVNEPVATFTGHIIAIIRRADDVEEKWVVCPENVTFTKDEIMKQVEFQEKYFKSEIIM